MATPSHIALSNQSLTFEVFGDGEKLTIIEATERVNEKLKAKGKLPLSEQTVRRAMKSLIQSGFIKEHGRQNNAVLYGKLSASWADSKSGENLIPLAGNLVSVEDFLRLMVSSDTKPLQLRNEILSQKSEVVMRRLLAFVVFRSPEAGMDVALKNASKTVTTLLKEVNYVQSILQSFLDSPVWFTQYRDRIGYEIRKMQEKDPELYQLTEDFITGG